MGARITIDTGSATRPPFTVLDANDTTPGRLIVELPDTIGAPDIPMVPVIGLSATPAEYAQWHGAIPGAAWGRVFYGAGKGLPSFQHSSISWLVDRHIVPHVSTKDRSTAEQYRAEFDAIPDGILYKRTYHHEPEGDDLDPTVYQAEYRLMRQVRDDHPRRDQITIVAVHNLWASRYKPRMNWRAFMVPDYADVNGWDCYWPEDLAYEAPESLLGLPVASSSEFGMLRWELTELGASTSRVGRGQWLTDVVEASMLHGCESVGLWCSKRTAYDYRPTDAETLAAFQRIVGWNATAAPRFAL